MQFDFRAARCSAGLFFCLFAVWFSGCSEEERFPELEEAPAHVPSRAELGVGVFHGDALGLAISNAGSFQGAAESFEHAFFRLKSYDEYSVSVGEFHSHAIRDEQVDFTVRGPAAFPDTGTSAGRLAPRAADIVLEMDRARDRAGGAGFETVSFVVDFYREVGDWFVRWDGNISSGTNREGMGNYGFDRAEMVEELLDHLEAIAAEHEPAWIVVGDWMERLLVAADATEGISPAQFEHFRDFFERAVVRIHEASPGTRVAAGFHWEHVAGPVAAHLTGVEESELGEEELDLAFQQVILPFAEAGDGVALRLRVARGEAEPWKYQFLRRLSHLYGLNKPLVIYSLSTLVTSSSAYRQQRLFLEEILEHLGGVGPEVIAWERLTNIEGVDTADQSVIGRCLALSGEESRVQMEEARCYDGLFSLGMGKEVFESLAAFSAEQ
jgi:hypothetical protein